MLWLRHKKRFNHCEELASAWPELQTWYSTALGQQLALQEQELLHATLANLFGYHLVQVGRLDSADWLAASRVSHRVVLDFPGCHGGHSREGYLVGEPQCLPLQSDSIDVVVLPHVLEFSHFPHEVLREVERVLIPEGHLVMLAFNPWSLWGTWRPLAGWQGRTPWCARFLGTTRLKDWLALLGFDVITVQGYFFGPPFQSDAMMRRLGFLERMGERFWPVMGASNLLVARKRVTTLTPIRPRWRTPQRLVASGLEPTQNHRHRRYPHE